MKYYIGIDLGTSSCKGILCDRDGNILKIASRDYPVSYPHDGWTEQSPERWLSAAEEILKELSESKENEIFGLSFGGQMHGLVVLDENDDVIRPCILWNDGRTAKETEYLNTVIGKEKLTELTGNIAFAGFTAPKILWIRENEPENFKKIRKIMLPKDYLAYKLTGVFSSDYSDASGMLLLDVKNKCWSREMCDICHISEDMLPKLYESYEVTGKVLPEYGLPNCIVTAGAGDNAAAAVGTGAVTDGACNVSIGTSGTVFIVRDEYGVDDKNALHSFVHANGKWHLMGCILTAASARKWWLEDVIGTSDYSADDERMENAADTPIFLPYLSGERSPHNDVDARGAFIGLSATTTRAEMSRAIIEGVTFALKDCLSVAIDGGAKLEKVTLCGGGAKSRVWRQIIADVFNLPVTLLQTEQGPALGGAILAMVGAGEYKSLTDATENIVKISDTVYPISENVEKYKPKYELFKRLYPALKSVR